MSDRDNPNENIGMPKVVGATVTGTRQVIEELTKDAVRAGTIAPDTLKGLVRGNIAVGAVVGSVDVIDAYRNGSAEQVETEASGLAGTLVGVWAAA